MSAASILFPLGGPRLSTIAFIAVMITLAIGRGDKRPAVACAAWLFGWEALFQVVTLALGRIGGLGPLHSIMYLVIAAFLLPWATFRVGVKPSLPLLGASLVVFAVWVAFGFHVNVNVNGTGSGFSVFAEVLNELAKSLWALAYLVPVLRPSRPSLDSVATTA